jgi:hypothetical protein
MSNGTKKEKSALRSKPKPPKGYEQWFEEYKYMTDLADKSERESGQTDTYWHTRKAALEAAFKKYGLEVE